MARCVVTRVLPGPALERLRGHEVELWRGPMPPGREWLLERAPSAEGILSLLTDRIDGELIATAPRLRVISNYAVGVDNIDVLAAAARAIPVGCTPDVLTDATADLAMALLLALARRLREAERDLRAGRWLTWEPARWLGLELRGATLAIVGPGRIGTAVAERARAFGMEVLPFGRRDDLRHALERADVISLHAPLTAGTRHLIGEDALRAMKPTALLINTARGGLIDQAALARALAEGWIAGAALDVSDPEPLPADDGLLEAPNLLLLPHIGSATRAARAAMAERAVSNLLAGLEGAPLPYPAPAPRRT
jgi:glyoxylate reductase